ncbi:hypothetical protein BATDEDRAFT_36874 [Batrachochytrium dendrobatidis JAM81]|uniref:Copper acquisition factor BIM1-like domain-containing protein n=2 Tax=Batrachochytrium dendrobatidis TaxID=109871 RepID=F4P0T4_BATDJ|nr:uncharacterized protein BATDEDRAFT_36874 [Batrachochytrium dendrobatidis JAM81]EGF81337.1 hypothetical protein BATDEDRAFT_36874 [Batrachochytrium dendrobatidis JAM81]KAJ8329595.1 hypothetical protein O5D80_002164 [Batrachochytrium dendrobatidis]KAK5669494.1 hypothetical protein QVD99_003887 [Batrachochytrium dendrobatidis]OAJ38015.1 hypothetical protein BDEG_21984 [Batrachochytrium dendrobatidis JEL423]|eukprot:XP_006678079.1 hypothetical protein BATDEDRAFT_36874 [Batrachochytrium dendrobatidis JAM81]
MLVACLFAFAAISPAAAHFTMTSPPARGTDELVQDQGPCGGFGTPSSSRATFGGDSKVSIRMADSVAEAVIYLGVGDNPTSFPHELGRQSFTKIGVYDMSVDFSKLPDTVSDKTQATVQVVLSGGHGTLYQCGDVVVNRPASAPAPAPSAPAPAPAPTSQSAAASTDSSPTSSKPSGSASSTATHVHPNESEHTHSTEQPVMSAAASSSATTLNRFAVLGVIGMSLIYMGLV